MRSATLHPIFFSALLACAGCATGTRARVGPEPDAGSSADVGMQIDTGALEAGPADSGASDAGARDGAADLGADSAMRDAGVMDARVPEIGMDAAVPDAAMDAGITAACALALDATRNGFETQADGWLTGNLDGVSGSWPFNPWEWGTPRSGQPDCAEGTTCFGTDLDDNYAQCGRGFIESPAFNVAPCGGTDLALVMSHYYRFWTGPYDGSTWTDGGVVEVSTDGGDSWLALSADVYPGTVRINPDRGSSYACIDSDRFYLSGRPGFVGASGGWEEVVLPLPADALSAGSVTLRFSYSSGVSSSTTNANSSRRATDTGWFIDDVRIEAI
ncbi:MAG: hypothetical protein AAF938_14225 [Myxococcota bacterium]